MSSMNYKFIKKIGQGSYGEVWLVEEARKKYVLKKISFANASEKDKASARLECELLKKLIHPNIVQYRDSFEENGSLYIAMAYCECGDLYTHLKEQKGKHLLEKQITEWLIQIVMALQFIHERNILHRDLKTQNIFLARKAVIKVGDLGIAKQLQDKNDMASTQIGTPYYMSPELFEKKPYNFKSDIWSLGCVTYEMASLKHAFNAKDFVALGYKIMMGQLPNMPSIYSRDLIVIMESMLNKKPEKRPSAKSILKEPYIQQHIKNFINNATCASTPSGHAIIRGRDQDLSENKSRNNCPSPSRNSGDKLPNRYSPVPLPRNSSPGKPKRENDDNYIVCQHVSKYCPANCPNKKNKDRPKSGQTELEKEIEKIDILSQLKKSPEHGMKHSKSSPQIEKKEIKPVSSHGNSEEDDRQSSIDNKIEVLSRSSNSPIIIRKGINQETNSDEKKSARSRRRDKNRNLGLKTMLFSHDVGGDKITIESDESEKADNANNIVANKPRARNRRGHSLDNEIVILPELKRISHNDTLSNTEKNERAELVEIVEKMNETLSYVCKKPFVAVKDSLLCARNRFDRTDGAYDGDNIDNEGPEENCEETLRRTKIQNQKYPQIRKEIMKTIGYKKLNGAYEILRDMTLDHESLLKELLGTDDFTKYIAKIMWLMMVEE